MLQIVIVLAFGIAALGVITAARHIYGIEVYYSVGFWIIWAVLMITLICRIIVLGLGG